MLNNNQYDHCPEVQALEKPAKNLVIFMHGLGADGEDLITLSSLMQVEMPGCHFLSPHGIEDLDTAPIGYGRQWFSLKDREPYKVKSALVKNIPSIKEMITKKQEKLAITNENTILVGFSQGAMVGIYLSLTAHEPFAGVVGFSGMTIPPDNVINRKTPICLIHGEEDEIIDVKEAYKSHNYLQSLGVPVSYSILANLRHTIDFKAVEIAVGFMKNAIKLT